MELNKGVSPHPQELSKSLNLMHLIAFGINFISPFGIVIIFGLVAHQSGFTVALPVLLACVSMLFIAHSYMYMVTRNPVAGSLYSYVDALLGKRLGFISGWILFLDYILGPTATSIVLVNYLKYYVPDLNWHVLIIIYIITTGLFNLFGVRILANIGLILLCLSEIVVFGCIYAFGHNILNHHQHLFNLVAFHFTSYTSLFTATTLAVFSYLGFDAISTLAEEAKNPIRDIPKAIFIAIVFSATTMFLIGYFAILSMPNFIHFLQNSAWTDNAFYYILADTGNKLLITVFSVVLIISMFIFSIVATTGASRLLYGMGRDRALPKSIFGKVNKRFKTPHYNIIIIVVIELLTANFISLGSIAEIINFGAITAFCIFSFAVFQHQIKQGIKGISIHQIIQIVIPLCGMLLMVLLIILMQKITLILGGCWIIIGLVYMYFNKHLWAQKKSDTFGYKPSRMFYCQANLRTSRYHRIRKYF